MRIVVIGGSDAGVSAALLERLGNVLPRTLDSELADDVEALGSPWDAVQLAAQAWLAAR